MPTEYEYEQEINEIEEAQDKMKKTKTIQEETLSDKEFDIVSKECDKYVKGNV